MASGALTVQMLWDRHLKKWAELEEPYCTQSQVLRYLAEDGRWLVEVHQYLRPDGGIGGSGRPDPKRLRLEDRIIVAEPTTAPDP